MWRPPSITRGDFHFSDLAKANWVRNSENGQINFFREIQNWEAERGQQDPQEETRENMEARP